MAQQDQTDSSFSVESQLGMIRLNQEENRKLLRETLAMLTKRVEAVENKADETLASCARVGVKDPGKAQMDYSPPPEKDLGDGLLPLPPLSLPHHRHQGSSSFQKFDDSIDRDKRWSETHELQQAQYMKSVLKSLEENKMDERGKRQIKDAQASIAEPRVKDPGKFPPITSPSPEMHRGDGILPL